LFVQVRAVVNLCAEYKGPVHQYAELGMTQLWLPTVDHFDPSVEDLEKAVRFIQKYKDAGVKVYVHCRAGHGRSAAVAFAWLLSQGPDADRNELNAYLSTLRDVRKTLWRQQNICQFHERLLQRDGIPLHQFVASDGAGVKEL
jgi:atypical dual specificity phosphatase